ncbi:MAG: enoyl-CoA hydratase-related protein, partial [SAR324 cluster bacterium]|nr:enoyl-CoA hydratase-related protein [SAR324 cluster bacterium]
MSYQFIEVVVTGDVMEITIQRPELLNALNRKAHAELADAFDRFAENSALNISVLKGSGERAFCVGSDLKERAEVGSDQMPPSGFAGLTERFDLDKPVIALVNGDAIGGGLEIILACDLAIAVDTARFGLPEPKVGLAASGGNVMYASLFLATDLLSEWYGKKEAKRAVNIGLCLSVIYLVLSQF